MNTQAAPTSLLSVDPGEFTGALASAANGVSIVTTDGTAGRAGLTVSSMCSVCAEPPLILACVNIDNEFCDFAQVNGVFAINILATRHTTESNTFAGLANDPDANRFLSGQWTRCTTGCPVLADALVSLDCVLESTMDHGTHRIHIGRVVGIREHDGSPLVYAQRDYAQPTALSSE